MKQKVLHRIGVLLKLSRPFLGRLTIACFLMLLGSLASLFLPILIGRFIDALTLDDPSMEIPEIVILMVIIMALQGAFSLSGGLIIAYADERVFADLRVRAFTHLHRLPLSFFADRKQGELVSRIENDVSEVSSAGPGNIAAIIRGSLTVLGSTTLMLLISPKLFLWGCIGVPILIPIVLIFGRKAFGLSRLAQDQEAEICGYIADNVRNNALVKSYNAIESEEQRFSLIVKKAFKTAIKYNVLSTLYRPATAIVSFAGTLVILVLGAREYSYGRIQPGDIIAFLLLIGMLMAGLSHLSSCIITLVSSAGAASRLFDILDLPTEPDGKHEMTGISGRISVQDLRFSYTPGTPVIQSLSFDLAAGQTLAVRGPSGTGKSTLLKLINAFYRPDSGTISFDDNDISAYSPDDVRRYVAYLEQEPHLIYGSIYDNLTFGMPDATPDSVEAAAKAAQAHEFISQFPNGYHTLIGEEGIKLSTGQRHRICLARALIKNAPILLLDEPGTALDAQTQADLLESLRPALAGKTCILVAHDSLLLDLADETITLIPADKK